jgi:hypothetical protein
MSTRLTHDQLHVIENTRRHLISLGYYIGDPTFPYANYVWLRCGRESRLVCRHDAKVYIDSIQRNDATPYPEHAPLSMIGHIPGDQYFLTSCGMWKGAKEQAPNIPFVDVKPSCLLAAPPGESGTRDDFMRGLQVLQRFSDSAQRCNDIETRGLFRLGQFGEKRLRLRHVLFEAKGGDDSVTHGESLPFAPRPQGIDLCRLSI